MAAATVTSKGQVTIPVEVRKSLGLHPGSRVAFIQNASGSFEIRVETKSIRDVKGSVSRPSAPVSIDDMNAVIAEAWAGEPDPC